MDRAQEAPMIEITDVSVDFDSVTAVRDLNLHVARGERVAFLGQTGAGKSTMLNLLVGALSPSSGSVRVAGLDPVNDWAALQGKFAIAFQGPRLLPWRTALANVSLGMQILGIERSECRRRAEEWLTRMHLENAADRYPAQLSGGMRQRVALARAFSIEPSVLLLDEAFSALDEVTSARLRADFVKVAEATDVTSVIVTHSIREAFELAHRVIVLRSPATVAATFDTSKVDVSDAGAFHALTREVTRSMTSGDDSSSVHHPSA